MPFVENMEVSLALLPQLEATIWPEDELAPILRLCHDFQLSRRYVLSQYFGQQTNYGLSHREQEIAQLAARDKSNKEIADQLFLSENTVKAALRIIFQKLGLRDEKNKRQALRHFFQGK